MPLHPINHTLLAVLDNQMHRTDAALDGIPDDVFNKEQPGGCSSIRAIGEHLIKLRIFQLRLLESDRVANIPDPESGTTAASLAKALAAAADEIMTAIGDHDADDWNRVPKEPREGKWGEEATLTRFVKPFNDFTNHLGAIRALRRQCGCATDVTQ